MKKTFYAAMLLLGLGIILTACNNNGTSKGDSQANASVEKEWTKAMGANGHIFFNTGFGAPGDAPVYMLMMPYVFSKDGTRGVIYAVYRQNEGKWLGMSWFAQYEVNGEYLLLTNIVEILLNHHNILYPLVMKIDHNNGRFVLKGRYPKLGFHDPIQTFYQISDPSGSEDFFAYVENDRRCMHK